MGTYVPNSERVQQEMLDVIGVKNVRDLYCNVPKKMFVKELNLPSEKSELEVRAAVIEIAEKNRVFKTCLRGAGAYRHFIPAVVKSITSREELVTAYTPYQAEISQGILQSIFEYQTEMCELTGMDVSNASVYDGATAAAESITMCRDRKRTKAYVSATANPQVIETMQTYCFGSGVELTVIPAKNGKTDEKALKAALGEDAACFYLQQPNYFGLMEDAAAIGEIVHAAGAKYVMGVNPIACALMKTPAECGADVAVGEGQPLGLDVAFGGPYLGFMTATHDMMRHLPGRIVGETHDVDGKVGYVLTLTAREQHIRREKATSNICSNEQLCAFTAGLYMAAMGASGMRQAATLSMSKAHYLAKALQKAGLSLAYKGEFFHEFVTACDEKTAKSIEKALEKVGILGGLSVDGGILWCATEVVTKAELDKTAEIVKEVLSK
ncbi:MAG: aminomethyl-transferring glycine dehydrogenase subunit GcvPA [Oscillibacter sp.]|jgi:glycine dehydrogenase subunit 1|nr:aminomethyl-transferring glycine dehydrogenase subunit GcvPA [Oscillibacter sp.]